MKYYKRLNVYKASNVCFNPETRVATSYNWWQFVKIINGLLVFNSYRYSVSTSQHQAKVRRLLDSLGIRIDLIIEAPQGLQQWESCIDYYRDKALGLRDAASKKGTKRAKNTERLAMAAALDSKAVLVEQLLTEQEEVAA